MNLINRKMKGITIINKILNCRFYNDKLTNSLSENFSEFNSKNYSMEIDSLRGVAILLVFFVHVLGAMVDKNIHIPHNGSGFFFSFIFSGATGVTLFFVISSFLLSIPFYLKSQTNRIKFYKKRLLRILPLFFITVSIAGLMTPNGRSHPSEIFKSYFFLFDQWKLFPFCTIWWSLRTEMEFYLLLGLLMPLIHFRKGRRILLLSIAGILGGRYVILNNAEIIVKHRLFGTILSESVFAYAPTFLIGIFTSFIYLKYGSRLKTYFNSKKAFKNGLSDILFLFILFMLSFVLFKVAISGGMLAVRFTWPQHYTYEACFWGLILLSLIVLPLKLKFFIINKYLSRLGKISYSFYLIHFPVIFYINGMKRYPVNINLLVKVLFIFVIVFIFSLFSYWYIEKPFLNIKDKLK